MSVPVFDAEGALPPGEHGATWEEIVDRFGFNDHRMALLAGLELAVDQLKRTGATRVFLDGSLTTDKALPNDYDGCYEISNADLPNLPPTLGRPAMRAPRQIMKVHFLGELLPAHFFATMSPAPQTYREFFQRDRNDRPRGIVVLDLGSW